MISKFIRRNDVLNMTGLSKSSVYRLMNENLFPASIKLSERSVAWDYQDVLKWMEMKKNGEWDWQG